MSAAKASNAGKAIEARHYDIIRGRQSDVKKAIVTLAEGDRIDVTTGL